MSTEDGFYFVLYIDFSNNQWLKDYDQNIEALGLGHRA